MYRFFPRCLAVVLIGLFMLPCHAVSALPTLLNSIPSTDLIPADNLMLQMSYYGFNFTDDATRALIRTPGSMIYSIGYGMRKVEFGADVVSRQSFSDTTSGLYAGPTSFNFKYRICTQGTGNDTFSLVAGAFNIGTHDYGDAFGYYRPSPYLMLSHAFKEFRLHLGYQWNLFGFHWVDADRKGNDDVLAGFDAVIIKHRKRPVSLLIDYAGGPLNMVAYGIFQTLNPEWSWGISYYVPVNDHLPVSNAELPRQFWVGITRYFPL
ncbi:hypothetical protein KBA41_17175 [Candidatus Ozemobacteraceae bacterium]|nr:hypothetical protein [Candidatus Ozemobacteraceae bacterium]